MGAPERGTYDTIPAWLDEPYLNGLLRDTVTADVMANMRKPFAGRDPKVTARNRQNYEKLKQSVARLSAAGAAVILGSDTGLEDNFFGYTEHRELQLMVEAGMTPAQVLVAATSRAAQFMGLSDAAAWFPASAPIFLCSTPIRSTIFVTPAASPRCISPAPRSIAPGSRPRCMKSAAN